MLVLAFIRRSKIREGSAQIKCGPYSRRKCNTKRIEEIKEIIYVINLNEMLGKV